MAQREIKTIFALDGETKYREAIGKISKEQSMLGKETKAMAEQYRKSGDEQKALETESAGLAKQIELQKKKVEEAAHAVEQSIKVNGENSEQTRKYQLEVVQAQNKLSNFESQLEKTNKAIILQSSNLNKAGKSMDEMGDRLQKTGDKLEKVGETLTDKVSKPIAGMETAALALGAATVKASSDMESSLNQFAVATGKSKNEAEQFRDVLGDIYKDNFGEGFGDIANTMALINQQMGDMEPEKLKETSENALMLRDVFDLDINEGIRGANALMKQFGVDSTTAYNLMAQGAQKGLNQNQDLADQISEYAVYYADMGFSIEEMFAILENGTKDGVFQIDFLNDAMKEMGNLARSNSDATKEAFSQLGLNADKITRQFTEGGASARAAFTEVATALFNVDDSVQQNTIGLALFGTKWEDLGIDAVKALTNTNGTISVTQDKLKEISELKYEDMGSMFAAMGREIQMELMPAANEIAPILKDIIKETLPDIKKVLPEVVRMVKNGVPVVKDVASAVLGLIKRFADLNPKTQELIIKGGLMVAALGPVVKVTGQLTKGFGNVTSTIGKYISKLAEKKAAEAVAETATGGLAAAFSGAGGLLSLLNPTTLAIGGVTAALGLVAIACYKAGEDTRKYNEALVSTADYANEFIQGIDTAKSALDGFDDSTLMTAEHQQKLQESTDHAQSGITEITARAVDERRTMTQEEFDRLQELIDQLGEFADGQIEAYEQKSRIVQAMAENEKNMTMERAQELIKAAEETRDQVIEIAEGQKIKEYQIADEIRQNANNLRAQGNEEQAALEEERAAQVEANADAEYQKAIEHQNQMTADTISTIQDGYMQANEEDSKRLIRMQEIYAEQEKLQQDYQTEMAQGHDNAASKIMDRQGKLVAELEELQKGFNAEFAGNLAGMTAEIETYGGEQSYQARKACDGVIRAWDRLPNDSKETMRNSMQSMIDTLKSKSGSLFSAAAGIANGFISTIKDKMGIHSPSREMRLIAENIVNTTADTVDKNRKKVSAAAGKMADDVLSEAKRMEMAQKFSTVWEGAKRVSARALHQTQAAQGAASPLPATGSAVRSFGDLIIPIYVNGNLVGKGTISSEQLEKERVQRARAMGVMI